jgi:hypothetical protein
LHPQPGELDPFLSHTAGGFRVSGGDLIHRLLGATAAEVYLLGQPLDKTVMLAGLAENVDKLREAIDGKQITAYEVMAFDRITLPIGSHVTVPWGVLHRAPQAPQRFLVDLFPRHAGALVVIPFAMTVVLDRSREPTPGPRMDPEASARIIQASLFFPLACCLATEGERRKAPVEIWRTTLSPFTAGSYGRLYFPVPHGPQTELNDVELGHLEQWAESIHEHHTSSMDVSARRIVSALSQRTDVQDVLIDAVIVWENLFGTSPETSFRLCAAITKLLEKDVTRRGEYLRQVSHIYQQRNKVAHGSSANPAGIHLAATAAVDIAVECLRALYRHRTDLIPLSSADRANALLLA